MVADNKVIDVMTNVAVEQNIDTSDKTKMLSTLFAESSPTSFWLTLSETLEANYDSTTAQLIAEFLGNIDWGTDAQTTGEAASSENVNDLFKAEVLEIFRVAAEAISIPTADQRQMLRDLFVRSAQSGFLATLQVDISPTTSLNTLHIINGVDWSAGRAIDWVNLPTDTDIGGKLVSLLSDQTVREIDVANSYGFSVQQFKTDLRQACTVAAEALYISTSNQPQMLQNLFARSSEESFLPTVYGEMVARFPDGERLYQLLKGIDWTAGRAVNWNDLLSDAQVETKLVSLVKSQDEAAATSDSSKEQFEADLLQAFDAAAEAMHIPTGDIREVIRELFERSSQSSFLPTLHNAVLVHDPEKSQTTMNLLNGIDWTAGRAIDWANLPADTDLGSKLASLAAETLASTYDADQQFRTDLLHAFSVAAQVMDISTDNQPQMLEELFNGYSTQVEFLSRLYEKIKAKDGLEDKRSIIRLLRRIDWNAGKVIEWSNLPSDNTDIGNLLVRLSLAKPDQRGFEKFINIITIVAQVSNINTDNKTEMCESVFESASDSYFLLQLHDRIENRYDEGNAVWISRFLYRVDWTKKSDCTYYKTQENGGTYDNGFALAMLSNAAEAMGIGNRDPAEMIENLFDKATESSFLSSLQTNIFHTLGRDEAERTWYFCEQVDWSNGQGTDWTNYQSNWDLWALLDVSNSDNHNHDSSDIGGSDADNNETNNGDGNDEPGDTDDFWFDDLPSWFPWFDNSDDCPKPSTSGSTSTRATTTSQSTTTTTTTTSTTSPSIPICV